MRLHVLPLLPVLPLLLASCATEELSSSGAGVRTAAVPPPSARCSHLGTIIGKGGGTFGGAWLSNESLIEHAMNNLRNQAAEMGADYVQMGSPSLGAGDKGVTTTATVTGDAYHCGKAAAPRGATAIQSGKASATDEETGPAIPKGAAGFTFRSTVVEASEACKKAGHTWTEDGDGAFRCSGAPVDTGLGGDIALRFCRERLCGVVVSPPLGAGSGAELLETFVALKRTLTQKYGRAEESETAVPPDCKSDVVACIKEGRTSLSIRWAWPKGPRVTLSVEKVGDAAPLRVVYGIDVKAQPVAPKAEGL